MESGLIDVHLAVEKKDEKVLAHLIFSNKSDGKFYLNKQVMYYNGEVRNDYLEVTGDNDVMVDYLGMMANCTREPEEFVVLAPGEKISVSIPLSDFYKLEKGNNYSIQYNAYNPSLLKAQEMMEMQSNEVEIAY